VPIVAPYLWPKYEPKDRRGITLDEHQSILANERKAEWKLFLELLWETGAAQSDAANFKAEDIDRQTRTISYFRQKTGSLAQFTISTALEKVLQQLPTTGALFPNLSTWTESDRASRFRRRCHKAGVLGVTLHCYRYAWGTCKDCGNAGTLCPSRARPQQHGDSPCLCKESRHHRAVP